MIALEIARPADANDMMRGEPTAHQINANRRPPGFDPGARFRIVASGSKQRQEKHVELDS
jgi:hypothetical protein